MKALFVVDMQYDFVDPKGKLPVPNATKIVGKIKRLLVWSSINGVPRLGSADRHFEDDLEMKQFPPHCMDKTKGQELIKEMFLNKKYPDIHYIPNKIGKYGTFEQIQHGQLIEMIKTMEELNGMLIFEKQTTDVFTNPHIDFVLEKTAINEVIVVGIATDYCVKEAVTGFLKRGIKVKVVKDAIEGIDENRSRIALKMMYADGADLITIDEALQ